MCSQRTQYINYTVPIRTLGFRSSSATVKCLTSHSSHWTWILVLWIIRWRGWVYRSTIKDSLQSNVQKGSSTSTFDGAVAEFHEHWVVFCSGPISLRCVFSATVNYTWCQGVGSWLTARLLFLLSSMGLMLVCCREQRSPECNLFLCVFALH